jgi:hypothetical protein
MRRLDTWDGDRSTPMLALVERGDKPRPACPTCRSVWFRNASPGVVSGARRTGDDADTVGWFPFMVFALNTPQHSLLQRHTPGRHRRLCRKAQVQVGHDSNRVIQFKMGAQPLAHFLSVKC